jgi:hypothetical protein
MTSYLLKAGWILGTVIALVNTVPISNKAVGETTKTTQFRCIQASALSSRTTAQPPPLPIQSETRTNQVVERLNPVCPQGQLPQSTGVFAPKGRLRFNQRMPQPNNIQFSNNTHYFYAGKIQVKTAIGAFASLSQHKPNLALSDSHTLAELAVQSADGKQIVEVGWTVDRIVNKNDSNPHLFVFHWVNGKETCYNGCGFVQVSTTRYPGMPVKVTSSPQQVAIKYFKGNWWVLYQNEWIGYFPGSLWNSQFTQVGMTQWFGEVASSQSQTCTDMGNGKFGTAPNSAFFRDMRLLISPTQSEPAKTLPGKITIPSYYNQQSSKGSSFYYGGPGGC